MLALLDDAAQVRGRQLLQPLRPRLALAVAVAEGRVAGRVPDLPPAVPQHQGPQVIRQAVAHEDAAFQQRRNFALRSVEVHGPVRRVAQVLRLDAADGGAVVGDALPHFDVLAVDDPAGVVHSDHLGEGRVRALRPSANHLAVHCHVALLCGREGSSLKRAQDGPLASLVRHGSGSSNDFSSCRGSSRRHGAADCSGRSTCSCSSLRTCTAHSCS